MPSISEIKIFDIATSAGCLKPGTEKFAAHFRKFGLPQIVRLSGIHLRDAGPAALPELPRHNTPPIRNYPLIREVWTATENFIKEQITHEPGQFLLALGGDCSIVVGTMAGLIHRFGPKVHLIYLDGDVDSISPDPEKCTGSAGMGLWFLTQESSYWDGPRLTPAQITVVGNKLPPATDLGIPFVTIQELRARGIEKTISELLQSISEDTTLLIHLDVDIFSKIEMPAAYAPREEGLSVSEVTAALETLVRDNRVRYLEVTEFMPAEDPEGRFARSLAEVIGKAIRPHERLQSDAGLFSTPAN